MPTFELLYPHGALTEYLHETAYRFLDEIGRPFFPNYETDHQSNLLRETLPWLRDIVTLPVRKTLARRFSSRLEQDGTGFNLLALQLQSDYQVRGGSPFANPDAFLDHVLASFAHHAPDNRLLVIKRHPQDTGIENWPARLRQISRRYGLEARVELIKGGDLTTLLTHSRGAVMINSTTGIRALQLGVPICALGRAAYNIAGITHGAGLDSFWTNPEPPEPDLLQAFFRAIGARQVHGSFYNIAGQKAAITGIARLLAEQFDAKGASKPPAS